VRRVDWRRYLAPLLAAGLLAQVPFSLVIHPHAWNVMFTLLLGVLAVAVNDWLDRTLFKGAGAFGVLLVCLLNLWCDYPLFGCALIPLGVQLIRSRHALWWLPFLALCLLTNLFVAPAWIALALPVIVFGAARVLPVALFNAPVDREKQIVLGGSSNGQASGSPATDADALTLGCFALELDGLAPSPSSAGGLGAVVSSGASDQRPLRAEEASSPSRSPARVLPRWFAYAFYPAHLFALWALSSLIAGRV
jgi:hypothetical protein